MEADFSGYATKAGLRCSDGRTITADAFKHMDGVTVPLVWQHGHKEVGNVLGHAVLEARKDGVYAYGFFNDTAAGKTAKAIVKHGDVVAMSIYANQLVEKNKSVFHGMICEVSLVLSGANPGAKIDNVSLSHADGFVEELETDAIIHTGLALEINKDDLAHAEDNRTYQDIYDSLNEEQLALVHHMLAAALENKTASHSGTKDDDATSVVDTPADSTTTPEGTTAEGDLTHQEGSTPMSTRNVFDQSDAATAAKGEERHVLTHDAMKGIMHAAQQPGATLRGAVQAYALEHGINNIDVLFPEARSLTDRPDFIKRRTEWVSHVLGSVHKTPFSRIKSVVADITLEQARAKGYVKGTMKKEEWFSVSQRTTGPTTIYKKQKLDRDDIIDITDFDVVAWIRAEMRLMLEEEIARAVLIGDGRDIGDADKIKDPGAATEGTGIRAIVNEHDLYAATFNVNLDDADSSWLEFVNSFIFARRFYKGSGAPTFYTTEVVLANLLVLRDSNGHRFWRTLDDLAAELRVASIVPVEPMEEVTDLLGIMVNLTDYNVGADRGGEVNTFEDFDIDYNQHKYLIETRVSGALTKIRSALVFKKVAGSAALVKPVKPGFAANVITPATTTGVTYKRADTNATVTTGAPITLTGGQELKIYAVPASGSYYFENNVEDEWTFTYKA